MSDNPGPSPIIRADRPHSLRLRSLMAESELMAPPRATFTPPGIDRLLPVLLQHWRLVLFCTVFGLCAAIAALPFMETRYLISARVLVQLGREMTAPPTATAKEGLPQLITSKRPEDIGSEIEIMKSPQLFDAVVEAFGTDFFLAEPPAHTLWQQAKRLVRRTIRTVRETISEGLIMLGVRRPTTPLERVSYALQQGLTADEVRKSDVILVQLRMPSPEVGIAVLKTYLDLFLERHIAAYKSPRNREFFAVEAERSLRQLRAMQDELARFKEEKKAWSITEQSALLLRTQRDLIDSRAKTERETQELHNRIEELRRQEASLPPDTKLSRVTTHDPVNDEMRKQRALIETQISHAAVVFGDSSPQMIQLRRQLDAVNASLSARAASRGDQETTVVNQQLQDVRREIAATQTQLAGLAARGVAETEQMAQLEKSIRELTATETTLFDMQREITRLDREYQLYTARFEDSRISDAMDLAKISNVRVISPPTADPIPAFPPLLMVLAGGTLLGLVSSLAVVYLRDVMRPVVRTRREIEHILGVPVLASLPEYRGLR